MTISPNRRSTKRGRPLVTDGVFRCSRCQRMANQRRASWPGEQLCYSCFYAAMHTRGVCPQCGHDGILAGLATRLQIGGRSVCRAQGFPATSPVEAAEPKATSTGAQPVPVRPSPGPDRVDDRRRSTPGRYGPDRGGVVPGRSARQHPELETLARVQELLSGLARRGRSR